MIKYKASLGNIEAVQIVRETAKHVVIAASEHWPERKEAKNSSYSTWHDTWDEAHASLVSKQEKSIARLKKQISYEEERLRKMKELRND